MKCAAQNKQGAQCTKKARYHKSAGEALCSQHYTYGYKPFHADDTAARPDSREQEERAARVLAGG